MSSNDTQARKPQVRFFSKAKQNKAKSLEEGRPIFEDKEYVEFVFPGDKHSKPVFPAHERPAGQMEGPTYAEAYPEHYAAFKRGEYRAQTGTPLEMWPNPACTAARVAELKGVNIFSVEDLAAVTDSNIGALGMGGREFREQARVYLDSAKAGAGMSQLTAQNEDMKRQLAEMQAQIAALVGGQAPASQDKALDDCTDDELKAYIKRETGKGVPGNPSRDTLLAKAREIATKQAVAA